MSKCQYCDDGVRVDSWARYDGTGTWRMHRVHTGEGFDPINDYDSVFCAYNGWFRRHRLITAFIIVATIVALWAGISSVYARDRGQFASSTPEMKAWFDSLKSGKGLCCSDADGTAVSDVDWTTKDGHYRVRLEGEWIDVPDDAVITEPNRVGRTMVWPVRGYGGLTIRCFMPGSMT
jgi:hypothetical protein